MHTHPVGPFKGAPNNAFLTLTYSDEQLPADGSLCLDHFQRFAKRLRKRLGPFRYLHCGEYGETTDRPHYHALLFGQDFSFDRKQVSYSSGHPVFHSSTLEELWPYGFHYIGHVSYQSAFYTATYVVKQATGALAKEVYGDRKPEYGTMSRRPGLGSTWFDKYVDSVYPDDEVWVDGKSYRPPKYYDRLLEQQQPERWQEVLETRMARIKAEEQGHERRRVKERIDEARAAVQHAKRNADGTHSGVL